MPLAAVRWHGRRGKGPPAVHRLSGELPSTSECKQIKIRVHLFMCKLLAVWHYWMPWNLLITRSSLIWDPILFRPRVGTSTDIELIIGPHPYGLI